METFYLNNWKLDTNKKKLSIKNHRLASKLKHQFYKKKKNKCSEIFKYKRNQKSWSLELNNRRSFASSIGIIRIHVVDSEDRVTTTITIPITITINVICRLMIILPMIKFVMRLEVISSLEAFSGFKEPVNVFVYSYQIENTIVHYTLLLLLLLSTFLFLILSIVFVQFKSFGNIAPIGELARIDSRGLRIDCNSSWPAFLNRFPMKLK